MNNPWEHAFITRRNFGITASIEEQEVLVSVNGCRLFSVLTARFNAA